jgi:hypothetical protein
MEANSTVTRHLKVTTKVTCNNMTYLDDIKVTTKVTSNNMTYLDDIKAHVNYMLATSTIVTCP